MTLDQIFLFYDQGIEFEKTKALILTSKVAMLFGSGSSDEAMEDNEPAGDKDDFLRKIGVVEDGPEHGAEGA